MSIANSLRSLFKNHGPEILTGIGIAGMFSATIFAIKATPKALILIEDKKKEKDVEKLTPLDVVGTVWKCYIPSAVTLGLATACLISACSENTRRSAALSAAYTLSETALQTYKEKVVETIGEKREREVRDEIAQDKVNKNPPKSNEIIIVERGNTLCCDDWTGQYFKSDIDKLRRAEYRCNDIMNRHDYMSLNDVYYEMGLGPVGGGVELGFNKDDGPLDFDFSSTLSNDDTPCLVIRFEPRPKEKYDY